MAVCPGAPYGRRHMVRDWPPGNYTLRTHSSIVQNAREAVVTGEAVCDFLKTVSLYGGFP